MQVLRGAERRAHQRGVFHVERHQRSAVHLANHPFGDLAVHSIEGVALRIERNRRDTTQRRQVGIPAVRAYERLRLGDDGGLDIQVCLLYTSPSPRDS